MSYDSLTHSKLHCRERERERKNRYELISQFCRLCGAGARYLYSNFGYLVLGLVVDRFSDGVGYERFVQDLLRRGGIFRMKLGVTQSQYVDMSEVSVRF